jgi:hypothetical protein
MATRMSNQATDSIDRPVSRAGDGTCSQNGRQRADPFLLLSADVQAPGLS